MQAPTSCAAAARRAAVAVVAALAAFASAADGVELAPDQQAAVLLRAMAFDRSLKERAGTSTDVLIVWLNTTPAAVNAGHEATVAFERLEGIAVQGVPLRVQGVGVGDAEGLKAAVQARQPDAVYLCRGAGVLVAPLAALSTSRPLLTLAGDVAFVDAGLMLALDLSGAKPQLTVNLKAARASGVQLGSDLLSVARVLR